MSEIMLTSTVTVNCADHGKVNLDITQEGNRLLIGLCPECATAAWTKGYDHARASWKAERLLPEQDGSGT